jgi:AcrR family transcriptional regulator
MSNPAAPLPAASRRRRRAARGDGELLRGQILAAAAELLESTGSSAAVSMRTIAQRVGVTTPSIYLHFTDKHELIQAVVAEAFAELDRSVRETIEDAANPCQRLLACGQAYVAFALKHPEHYRIALMSQTATPCTERGPARAVLQFLKPLVDDYVADRSAPASASLPLTLELWATAHGIASLLIVTPDLSWGDIPTFVERTLCAALGAGALIDTGE